MLKRFPVLAVAVFMVAGCASNVSLPYQGVDYASAPKTRMNMGAVLIDTTYAAPAAAPNVDHQLTPTPADALRLALSQHYPAMRANGGGASTLRFEIKEASVTEQHLATPEKGLFGASSSAAPDYQYNGHLVVEAAASGPSTRNTGFIHAESTRSISLAPMEAADRQRHVAGMVAQMVDDVIVEVDKQIDVNMSSFHYGDGSKDFTVTPQPSGRWDHVYNPPVPRAGM